MSVPSLPRKKPLNELRRADLVPLPMTEEDWTEFALGVELFNGGKFWHAHEAWEQVWKRRPEDSRIFLQGFILMAAAYHTLVEKRRYIGTLNNFEKALPRLKLFEPEYMGVKITPLVRAMEKCRAEVRRLGGRRFPNREHLPKIEWRGPL